MDCHLCAAFLVRPKGQVTDEERAARPPGHRAAVGDHFLHCDRQSGVMAVDHHRPRIPHQEDVETGLSSATGGRQEWTFATSGIIFLVCFPNVLLDIPLNFPFVQAHVC